MGVYHVFVPCILEGQGNGHESTKGDNHRHGVVRGRSQTLNPKTGNWVKRDSDTGRFMDQKSDAKPFKGVRKEK